MDTFPRAADLCPLTPGLRGSGAINTELVADGSCGGVLDLAVPGDWGAAAVVRVAVDRVVGTFAVEMTAAPLDVANQLPPFHEEGTSTEMVSQMAFPEASFWALSR